MKFTNCFRIGVGLLAVMLLVLGGCGGDSNSDIIAPSLTILPVTPVTTTTASRTLSGTVEAGASVVVTVGTTEFPATVTDTSWTCSIDLAPGANAIAVRAEDATGNSNTLSFALTYDAVSIEVYTTPIPVGSVTVGGLVDGSNYTSPLQVTVTPADSTVAPFTVDASVGNNTWSADLTGLANGANAIKVSNVIAGVADPVERTVTVTVDSAVPQVSFDPSFSYDPAAQSFPSFAVPSQTVAIDADAAATSVTTLPLPVGGAATYDAGQWHASILGLAIGKNSVTATATVNGKTASARTLLFVDQTPPLVTSVSPAQGQLAVAADTAVVVVFSAEMDGATIDSTTFSINDGAPTPPQVSYDPDTRTATLNPSADLTSGATYTVTLTTGIKTADGTPLPQQLSWDFTVQ